MVMYKIDRRGGGGQKSFSRKLPIYFSLVDTRNVRFNNFIYPARLIKIYTKTA